MDTFYKSLKEGNSQLFEDIMTKVRDGKLSLTDMNISIFAYFNSNYDRWIKNMDKEFSTVFRSEEFLSSLSKYVDSLVDLHSIYKQAGYPVGSMNSFFNYSQKQVMSFLSASKKLDLTPHEVLHTNGKVRLLHFIDDNSDQKNKDEVTNAQSQGSNNNGKSITKPSLLIVYAPINRFHILDINQDKSIVAQLLRKGIDVYLLDWGYPDQGDDDLSISDYAYYIDEAVQTIQQRERKTITVTITKSLFWVIVGVGYSL
jgi:hypothetical protein